MDDESRVDIIPQPADQNEAGDSPRKAGIEYISRIPYVLRNKMLESYVPQVVSLGPFHFGKPQVAKGENNKQWCKQYLSRRKDLPSFDKLVDDISSDQWMIKIQQWYDGQGNGGDERLGRMMALDGLFLLRFLRDITQRRKPAYLGGNPDPFEPKSQIEEDIVNVENQIPFFVVKMVLQWDCKTVKAFNSIIRRACNYLGPFQEMNFSHDPSTVTSDSHLLGFMYENIIGCQKESSCTLRQAADLYSKGVKFMHENIIRCSKEDNQKKKSNSSYGQPADYYSKKRVNFNSTYGQAADFYSKKGVNFKAQVRPALNGIRFNYITGTFHLPTIKMDRKTDVVMRNLLAYEALVHKDSAKPLLGYMDLMGGLINEPEDVHVLMDGGIIKMQLSNNQKVEDVYQEVADIWEDLREVLDQYGKKGEGNQYATCKGEGNQYATPRAALKGEYIPIDTAVDGFTTFCNSKYCKYRMLYLEFKETYFSKPWLAAALFGGCFSLLLSLLQTIIVWKQLKAM